jgi:hypothetical protein
MGSVMFTTRQEIEDYLGEEGVLLLTDDLGSSETAEITRALEEADDYILMYLLERYEESALQGSSWIKRRATELACFFLFLRRGQQPPTGLAETFNRITDELDRISKSNKMIIPGANPREKQGPAISNYVVDDRRFSQRGVVDPVGSTNPYPGRREIIPNPFNPLEQ